METSLMNTGLSVTRIGVFSFSIPYFFVMNALEQRIQECKRSAQRSGKTPREVALKRVNLWKQVLQEVSDDYRGLDDEEFDQLIEQEIDSLREYKD